MSDLRRTIIDASVSIIEKEGVRAISFREVARKAKVSHQAPYHYFKNHHAILKAIAEEGFLKLALGMQSAARLHPDPLRALHASGVAYVQFALENIGYFRVMFQSPLVSENKPEARMPEAVEAHNVLLRLAESAHHAGIATDMDSQTLALLCWSTVHGIANLLAAGVVATGKPKETIKLGTLVIDALSAHLKMGPFTGGRSDLTRENL